MNPTIYQHVVVPAAWALQDLGAVCPEDGARIEELLREPDDEG